MGSMSVAAIEAEPTLDGRPAAVAMDLQTALEQGFSQRQAKTQAGPFSDLLGRLCAVPKGALKTVLGKELGVRVWRQARGKAHPAESAVSDHEIAVGLIRHLSQQGADALVRNERQGKFVRLTVWYHGGRSASARTRLPGLTQDVSEIFESGMQLFAKFEGQARLIHSVNLDVTATAVEIRATPQAQVVEPLACWARSPRLLHRFLAPAFARRDPALQQCR
jgi:hypothetical protein